MERECVTDHPQQVAEFNATELLEHRRSFNLLRTSMPDFGLTIAPLAAQLHGMNMSCQAFHPKDDQHSLVPILFGLLLCSPQ